ncbi:MAG: hypothetical protein ISQ31_01095 [Alphaproteobacteria bacterium]|nr:hypothetical protein [Alphaproteobacteria bacterium]
MFAQRVNVNINKERREFWDLQQLVIEKLDMLVVIRLPYFSYSDECMAHGPLLATRMFDFVGVKIQMPVISSFGSPQRQIYSPRD